MSEKGLLGCAGIVKQMAKLISASYKVFLLHHIVLFHVLHGW